MPGCMLPAVMAAGMSTPAQLGLLAPGPRVGMVPPSAVKLVYGTPLAHRLDTKNFSIQWVSASMSVSTARRVGEYMEEAWLALVWGEGWMAPTSSDAYLLTVILDPSLGGTGLTLIVEDEAYPRGVPLMYIHPEWDNAPAFLTSLCAHEFSHALQFGHRDWYSGGGTESWYWEASAEWHAEQAQPSANTYAWSAQYYAAAPQADHYSLAGYHQYGMFLLNAYLDEYRIGSDGFRDIWQENQDLDWTEEIAGAVGDEPAAIWAGFGAAYISESLRESHLYTLPVTVDGTTALEGWLGSHYIPLGAVSGEITLDGGVGAVVRGEQWVVFEGRAEIPSAEGEAWLVVVNPDPSPLRYSYSLGPESDPDTGETERPGPVQELGSLSDLAGLKGRGCGCATGTTGRVGWYLMPMLLWRRRAARG